MDASEKGGICLPPASPSDTRIGEMRCRSAEEHAACLAFFERLLAVPGGMTVPHYGFDLLAGEEWASPLVALGEDDGSRCRLRRVSPLE